MLDRYCLAFVPSLLRACLLVILPYCTFQPCLVYDDSNVLSLQQVVATRGRKALPCEFRNDGVPCISLEHAPYFADYRECVFCAAFTTDLTVGFNFGTYDNFSGQSFHVPPDHTHNRQASKAPWLRLLCSCFSTARYLASPSVHLDYCSLLNDVVGAHHSKIKMSLVPENHKTKPENQGRLRVKRHQKKRYGDWPDATGSQWRWRSGRACTESLAEEKPICAYFTGSLRAAKTTTTAAYFCESVLLFPHRSLGGLLLDRFC